MKSKHNSHELQRIDSLYDKITTLIEHARKAVYINVNSVEVKTRYEVGRYIFEDEQNGKRASYGKQILINLSTRLTTKYGKDWSYDTLKRCRLFYFSYNDKIRATMLPQTKKTEKTVQTNAIKYHPNFNLSWSHYLILMRIENHEERRFYEIESYNQNWSVRHLQRQVASSLYERLALSRDKNEVMRLANEGITIEKPSDIIKNPLTLEFLGLKSDVSYSESKLEEVIINKLQMFLLELGKGFLFESRQKRFTFDEDNFYVDLVFYNRLLQCYVLIDLKTDKLTHQDLGQMQMYVNYFDRYIKQDFEKPTIGILLCETKNDSLVELTLPKDANIYAQQYALCLPDKKLLKEKLREWIDEFNETNKMNEDNTN
jgi:predicted nuclease of restriction endonuclease-like (RecB) superfamily